MPRWGRLNNDVFITNYSAMFLVEKNGVKWLGEEVKGPSQSVRGTDAWKRCRQAGACYVLRLAGIQAGTNGLLPTFRTRNT